MSDVQKSTESVRAIRDDGMYMLLLVIAALIGVVGLAVAREVQRRDIGDLGSMTMQWLAEYRKSHAP